MASGRKDYFRHSVHAHEDEKMEHLVELGGFEAYGCFWVLIELCGKEYTQSGERETFTFRETTLRRKLHRTLARVQRLLDQSSTAGLLCYDYVEKKFEISIPNLKKFIGSYTFEETPNKVVKPPKERKEKEKKRNITFELEIEQIYRDYPRKEGRTRGMKSLKSQIKKPEDLKLFEQAVNNYAKQCIGKAKEYIKHFSTFANCWREYIEIEETISNFDPQRVYRAICGGLENLTENEIEWIRENGGVHNLGRGNDYDLRRKLGIK